MRIRAYARDGLASLEMIKYLLPAALLLAGCNDNRPPRPTPQQADQLNDAEDMLNGAAQKEEGPADRSAGPSNRSD